MHLCRLSYLYISEFTTVCSYANRFSKFGESDYIGEPVSIAAHSEQAADLARKYCNDDELVIGSLLHDIGHLVGLEAGVKMGMNGCGVQYHEHLGANFLAELKLPPRVVKFVESHVSAKRYLCLRNPQYFESLSDASKTTLQFQGGPMGETEAIAFENDPDFKLFLQMRLFDESAKIPNAQVHPMATYIALIDKLISKNSTEQQLCGYHLSPAQREFWHANGYLKVSNLLDFEGISPLEISSWVDDICKWPKTTNKWMQHWEMGMPTTVEQSNSSKLICRIENFANYHSRMNYLCRGSILSVISQLFGESGVLFKEKINFKLSGGAGFAAHQDTPAYIGLAEDHISAMVAVDTATVSNSCLEIAAGKWSKNDVPLTSCGILDPVAEAAMEFTPVECQPGDVLFFGGYTPHRSAGNSSECNRRALFFTYNPLSQGACLCSIALHTYTYSLT